MTNHTPSISVVLPCLFPDTKPIWMMMESCEKFGIVPVLYGMGGVFNGWVDIKIVRFFEALKQTVTDLVLYSDARDAFFLRGLPDIIATYGGLGSPPILMGTQDCYFTDHPDWFDAMPNPPDKVFRYIGLSTFMGQRDALLSAFTTISRYKGLPQDRFYGLHGTVNINMIQGTSYAYFYCVLVSKPGFGCRP